MERGEHLKYCTTCVKREFNSKKGIVCSLTGDLADFDPTCNNFVFDSALLEFERQKKLQKEQKIAEQDTFGLARFGLTKTIILGVLLILGGLIWLTAGLKISLVFYYPIAMIISGIILLFKGLFDEIRKPKRIKSNEHIIDEELNEY